MSNRAHNQGHTPGLQPGCRVMRSGRLVGRLLRAWAPHAVALLIILDLGLLSPISCILHCAIQRLFTQPAGLDFFLCAEHVAFAGQPEPAAGQPSAPVPRALYDLLSLNASLLPVAGLLVTVLLLPPYQPRSPLKLPPPTPPPRPL